MKNPSQAALLAVVILLAAPSIVRAETADYTKTQAYVLADTSRRITSETIASARTTTTGSQKTPENRQTQSDDLIVVSSDVEAQPTTDASLGTNTQTLSALGTKKAASNPTADDSNSIYIEATTSELDTADLSHEFDSSYWNGPPATQSQQVIPNRVRLTLRLQRMAMHFIGTPYVWGGAKPGGFDCSGFIQYLFLKVGITVPRTADIQYAAAVKIPTNEGRRGDLVFFQTYAPGASHVGMYLGHNQFIQACGHGVMISSLNNPYWRNRYLGMRRVVALR